MLPLRSLLQITRTQVRYLQEIAAALPRGHVGELWARVGQEQFARQALLSALLRGEAATETAAENAPGLDPAVAAQRKLHRLRGELEHIIREPVLTALTSTGGTTLIPHRSDDGWAGCTTWCAPLRG